MQFVGLAEAMLLIGKYRQSARRPPRSLSAPFGKSKPARKLSAPQSSCGAAVTHLVLHGSGSQKMEKDVPDGRARGFNVGLCLASANEVHDFFSEYCDALGGADQRFMLLDECYAVRAR